MSPRNNTTSNGATEISPSGMPLEALIEALIEGVKQLTEKVEDLESTIEELKEKVSDLSVPSVDRYGYDDE